VTDRREILRLTGILAALLVVTGLILLATSGGGSDSPDEGAAAGQRTVDGLVLEATPEQLRLRPQAGGSEIAFGIRQVDRPSFDVFHLQQHAADGLLTRVTYFEQGGRLYALRADDAPQANVP
jgi:hypothetical protein